MFLPQKNKIMGFLSINTPLVLFIASLGLLSAFLLMLYFDKMAKPSDASTPLPSIKTISPNKTESTSAALNALTSQLMTERQLTDALYSQNENLKKELQATANKSNLSKHKDVKEYLSALENLNNKGKSKEVGKKIDTTDYYNKVSLNKNNQDDDLLQNQINQFMDEKSNQQTVYLNSLKVEAKTRNNEVRSIRLKKGETIWMLAKRAYGNGLKYHKIMKANPQITEKNAKYLKVGTIIRVPL